MNRLERAFAVKLSEKMLTEEELERAEILHQEFRKFDSGFGYDEFGWEFESSIVAFSLMKFFYKHYFRVDSFGLENVPTEGRAIVAANHSGVVPMDAVMILCDLLIKMNPPRAVRTVIEKMFTIFPYAKDLMSRLGEVIGVKRNFDELLKMEQIVLVFPEGARGMGKTFSQRYKLTKFNVGHVELSIENRAPIVPAAVIGGEEQHIIIYNWKWIGRTLLDVNAFPLTLTWPWLGPLGLWPLPTKYYIYYGKPFRFWEEDPDAVSKAEVIRSMADRVQAAVQDLLNQGLAKRKHIFRRT